MAFFNVLFTFEADRAVFNDNFFPAFCNPPEDNICMKKLKTRGLTGPNHILIYKLELAHQNRKTARCNI